MPRWLIAGFYTQILIAFISTAHLFSNIFR
jgi:hypothetical protein